ncbi:MAG TPA: hypothetical protein VKS44_17195 [Candidatus Acidoferrales bacterium]|nr:hypothetical protein [Candidatus Acidoferrales bacterium]
MILSTYPLADLGLRHGPLKAQEEKGPVTAGLKPRPPEDEAFFN